MKLYSFLILFLIACSPTNSSENIKELASLDLDEVSGMEYVNGSSLIWTLQDSGNKNLLHGLDRAGKIQSEVLINTDNNDWESLASDAEGNLYIGDFGNNDNKRNDLAIYKVDKDQLNNKQAGISFTIRFKYPQQKDFPPKKDDRLFDCEAFYEFNGSFYLFTKNRSSNYDGSFFIYKVPNTAGNHEAQLIGTLKTCSNKSCQVTGADISPDGKTAALISEDKIYLLKGFTDNSFDEVQTEVLELGHSSQKEGICFVDDTTVLVTDERTKKSGGNLYEVNLKTLKGKI